MEKTHCIDTWIDLAIKTSKAKPQQFLFFTKVLSYLLIFFFFFRAALMQPCPTSALLLLLSLCIDRAHGAVSQFLAFGIHAAHCRSLIFYMYIFRTRKRLVTHTVVQGESTDLVTCGLPMSLVLCWPSRVRLLSKDLESLERKTSQANSAAFPVLLLFNVLFSL